MGTLDARNTSLWIETSTGTDYPPLRQDTAAEVCVIGGGLTGLLTAKLLADEGVPVVLVEAGRLCSGVSGYTTAKVTSQHRAIYSDLQAKHGEAVAGAYADAQQRGLELIAALSETITCDFRRAPAYVVTEETRLVPRLQREAETARALGLPATFTSTTDLPYPVAGALRFDDQAMFHPRLFCVGLAAAVVASGGRICEGTRALGVEETEDGCVVRCDGGATIKARAVLVATQTPFLYAGWYFARLTPSRSYVVAARCERAPQGMYITLEHPTRSIRSHPTDDGPVVILSGEEHATGAEQATDVHYRALEGFARDRFGIESVTWRWSAQDFASGDGLPFVGPIGKGRTRTFVAAGFDKWGMTNAAAAARAISETICGRSDPWAAVTDASRVHPVREISTVLGLGAKTAKSIVLDRLVRPGVRSPDSLEPGEAAVIRRGARTIAAFRDDDGTLHAVSAVCTHMSCIVRFNDAERSWDCPCHGSRFDVDGRVLDGPATRDLEQMDVRPRAR